MAEHEIARQAKLIRYELTALQGKVTELLQMAARLPEHEPDTRRCPECDLPVSALPRGTTLADHRHVTHDIEGDA